MSNEEYLVKIKTTQCSVIRILFESLKDILKDTQIIFDDKGLKIFAIDGKKVALVHLRLKSDKFDEYYIESEKSIGVNMSFLYKLLKHISNDDTLTLYITKKNESVLGIRVENSNKNSVTIDSYKLLEWQDEGFKIPQEEFDSELTMPAVEFQNLCRNLSQISETIEIKTIGEELHVSCDGDFASRKQIFGKKDTTGVSFTKINDPEDIVQGRFPLKYLLLFIKATNLCKTIQIYLKNDFPLIISYAVGDLGELRFGLSPKIDE